MSLASHYATILSGGSSIQKTLAYMKRYGHLSLLPQIVKILERTPVDSDASVVTFAKESDAKKFAPAIAEAFKAIGTDAKGSRTVIDPRLVGGYRVHSASKIVDRSFRTALVTIYHNAVRF